MVSYLGLWLAGREPVGYGESAVDDRAARICGDPYLWKKPGEESVGTLGLRVWQLNGCGPRLVHRGFTVVDLADRLGCGHPEQPRTQQGPV